MKKLRYLLSMFVLVLSMLTGCSIVARQAGDGEQQSTLQKIELDSDLSDIEDNDSENQISNKDINDLETKISVERDGEYTSKNEVAAYLNQYSELPGNFITKKQAKKLGWVSSEGNLYQVAPGKSIGGDHFGNFEERLPKKEGREYYECDIDTDGSYRGAKRIIYSDDGLIYYTEDHYETFELLYGEE